MPCIVRCRTGFAAARVNVKNYEKFGPEAALRAIAPVSGVLRERTSHGEACGGCLKMVADDLTGWSDEPLAFRL